MEDKGNESKLSKIVKAVPNYGALLISIGGIIFSSGVMWNNVNSIKDRVDKLDDNQMQVIKLSGDINLLHNQIEVANDVQGRTNNSVDHLSQAVNELGDSVSNLQGRLSVIPPPKKPKQK